MQPRAEIVHWLFATGLLALGLCLLAEAIVGADVWRMRPWRAYLWPTIAFGLGLLLWPVTVFYTNSTLHMLAHSAWAQVAMAAGAVELALVRGKINGRGWALVSSVALLVSGTAFLVHEQNPWLFSRAAFLHHALGWTCVVAALFPLGAAVQPRWPVWRVGFALTFVAVAVLLYCDRDLAPIFGHLSDRAGEASGP
jgi:hypothetical protein